MPIRAIQDFDSSVKVSIALPNAANTVCTSPIDLGNNAPFPITESFHVKLSIGQATGANSKNINLVLQHSNESNANFANIAGLGAPIKVIAGNATAYPASDITVTLPPETRRYIRGRATGEADGGNAADANLTVQLLF